MTPPPTPRAHPRFRPHGSVDYQREGRLVVSDAEGPFNLELVHSVPAALAAVTEPLVNGGPWGLLQRFHGSAMATPEAIAALTDLLKALRQEGRAPAWTAYVLPESVEGATLMLSLLRRCFQEAGLAFAHFDDDALARAWLHERLG